ncbi:MAG: hypothetical protein E6R14_10975 [Thermomicrobiales bacterium]|jgi:hypothetical protein|nr:MAG: hypothetical protein E6R14_10975 [Thermomicrobiales bacterium]
MKYIDSTLTTLFAEVREQAWALPAVPLDSEGALVRKSGSLHWASRLAGRRQDRYLGREDNPRAQQEAERLLAEREGRMSLLDKTRLLYRNGYSSVDAAAAATLAVLANLGFFRAGSVLVGTNAVHAVLNLLGAAGRPDKTEDIDLAQDLSLTLAGVGKLDFKGLIRKLEETGLHWHEVPNLPSHLPSVSLKVRKQALRIDFLADGPNTGRPRALAVGFHAEPLPHMAYLLVEPQHGVMLGPNGPVPVMLPEPARLALHKVFSASHRPVFEAAKRSKDLRQAADLLDALLGLAMADRIRLAWDAFPARRDIWESAGKLRNQLEEAGINAP